MSKFRFIGLLILIFSAAVMRLVPHLPNLTPITAIALFGGACFSNKRLAFLVPFSALFLSDLVIGLYPQWPVVYGSFAIIVCIGLWLRQKKTAGWIAVSALVSSVFFFLATNFGVWLFGTMYDKTGTGLLTCYAAAVPFFRNAIAGDLGYTLLLFGMFSFAEKYIPVLRESPKVFSAVSSA